MHPNVIAAMSTIAKLWKEPRCPSTDEWIKKMWYIYTEWNIMQPSKKELFLLTMTWMELEGIMPLVPSMSLQMARYHFF